MWVLTPMFSNLGMTVFLIQSICSGISPDIFLARSNITSVNKIPSSGSLCSSANKTVAMLSFPKLQDAKYFISEDFNARLSPG